MLDPCTTQHPKTLFPGRLSIWSLLMLTAKKQSTHTNSGLTFTSQTWFDEVSLVNILKAAVWKTPSNFVSCFLSDIVSNEGSFARIAFGISDGGRPGLPSSLPCYSGLYICKQEVRGREIDSPKLHLVWESMGSSTHLLFTFHPFPGDCEEIFWHNFLVGSTPWMSLMIGLGKWALQNVTNTTANWDLLHQPMMATSPWL